jgi:hypothetical protein
MDRFDFEERAAEHRSDGAKGDLPEGSLRCL